MGINVEAAAASSLVLTGLPTTETAGAGESFTVSAIDPYGNLAAAYVGMVTFSSTDPQAILPGSYTFTRAMTANTPSRPRSRPSERSQSW